MITLLFFYVIFTVLIGIGYISRIDDPYSRFLTIFGMPILIWIILGQLLHRALSHYHLPYEDEVEWLCKIHNLPK